MSNYYLPAELVNERIQEIAVEIPGVVWVGSQDYVWRCEVQE